MKKTNYALIYTLIFTILFGQTNLYSNTLFKTGDRAFINYSKKIYNWDITKFENSIEKDSFDNLPTSAAIKNQIMDSYIGQKCVAGSCINKVVYEFNYEFNYANDEDINVVRLQNYDNKTSKNEYSNTINSSSFNQGSTGNLVSNTKVDTIENIKPKVEIMSFLSNLGQKARTYGIKSWEDTKAKKLIIEAFRVNYIDMYMDNIKSYCKKEKEIPRLLLNSNSILALASHYNGTKPLDATTLNDLKNVNALLDINKDSIVVENGGLCNLKDKDLGQVLFNTGLFFHTGDIRINNKDHNINLQLVASLTSDAIYYHNGFDAKIIYDKDWKMHNKKRKKKIGRIYTWIEMTSSTDWVKLAPISIISDQNDFGSFNAKDIAKNGVKIAGLWPQSPISNGSFVTPEGHSINFILIPMKTYNGTGINGETLLNYSTWQKSSVKKSWALWIMILILIILIIIVIILTIVTPGGFAPAGYGIITAAIGTIMMASAYYMIAITILVLLITINFALSIPGKVKIPNRGMANIDPIFAYTGEKTPLISKTNYKTLLSNIENNIKYSYYSTNNAGNMFWPNYSDLGAKYEALDNRGNYSNYTGSFIWTMMKDASKYWNGRHITAAFGGFNTAVNILPIDRTQNASISKNDGGKGSMAPYDNYGYIVKNTTSIIDFSFAGNSKQNWKLKETDLESSVIIGEEKTETELRLERDPNFGRF